MGAPIGNQNGAKAKEWEQSLKRAMARRAEGDYRKTLDEIADRVVSAAMSGDDKAWREIADRMDGKPAQAIVGDSTFDPIQVVALNQSDAKL